MDRDKIIRQLYSMKKIETRRFAFRMFFLGKEYTFIKTEGDGFPVTCNRVAYKVFIGPNEVIMFVVLEYFMNDIRINYFSETEVTSELYEIGRAFEKLFLNMVFCGYMK